MIKRTVFRPSLLNSQIAKDNLRSHSRPSISFAFGTLDKAAAIFDGLAEYRETSDPLVTPEAHALKYRDLFATSNKSVASEFKTAVLKLEEDRASVRRNALAKSGLLADYGNAKELRAVLLVMKQPQRDATLAQAIKNRDHAVIAAIHGSHPLLIGETSVPLDVLVDQFVGECAPDEVAEISNIDAAVQHLELAFSQFKNSAEKMRDRDAEAAGEKGAKAAQLAEAKLGLALQATGQAG